MDTTMDPLGFEQSTSGLKVTSTHAVDRFIAPGLRLWQLLAILLGIMLMIVVIVCCFTRVRIPRTKRQIELCAAKRKMKKKPYLKQFSQGHSQEERGQTIVMNSLNHSGHAAQSFDSRDSTNVLQKSRQTAV